MKTLVVAEMDYSMEKEKSIRFAHYFVRLCDIVETGGDSVFD